MTARETPHDPWAALTRWTPARIGFGRAGPGTPTREVLRFAAAHALARDAVHAPFDADGMAARLARLGWDTVRATSDATDRALYLSRPDYGRRLSDSSREGLPRGRWDLVIVVGDGLSATAVHAHAVPLLDAVRPHLAGLAIAPVVIATGARVALGDDIAAVMGARAVAVVIGERPGLSAPDSLGAYLTFAPHIGRNDAERNCLSNIRAEGLAIDVAAFKLAWLLREAFQRGASGVSLKDESDRLLVDGRPPPRLVWSSP